MSLNKRKNKSAAKIISDLKSEIDAWMTIAKHHNWLTDPHYGHGDHGALVDAAPPHRAGEGKNYSEAVIELADRLKNPIYIIRELNDDEKTLVLTCFPEEAACTYYDRMTVEGINISLSNARYLIRRYIESLNIPTPTHPYLKAAPIVGLKVW